MKVAYLHVLPLEYYPPATNTLEIFSRQRGWQVKAWSSTNIRGLSGWSNSAVAVSRPFHAHPASWLPARVGGYLSWHVRAAAELAAWRPDAVISVEPHSALAAWFYYRLLRGRAPLFIHHHEYYAREDFESAGMRLLRRTMSLEREYLFPRAVWISQTNATRLRLLRDWNRGVSDGVARVLPNYPPADWIHAARTLPARAASRKLRMVYVGSASFEDTYIREVAEWVGRHPGTASLHVAGNNVSRDVWEWLESMHAPNITFDREGYAYEALPELLGMFDVGLILYKGNTANFVHNVPNKAVEYLACGLNVWYPIQMQGMAAFHSDNPSLSLRQLDFDRLADMVAGEVADGQTADGSDFPFTAEAALAPLIAELENLRLQRR